MCGIAGKVNFTEHSVSQNELLLMSGQLKHRGPDDQGIYINENGKVGLTHRRLSVIDLSPKGHQPMNYLNRYWIVFNGEIYNYQSEKEKLKKIGYRFKSTSDTEVLLALYDKYGINCLGHLRGFFAFAIFDIKKNTVFLARDRLGKKPLKYFTDGKVFCFASELKAILTQKEVHSEPDYAAINNYLAFGYVNAPYTGFNNIYKLEPGHYLFLDIGSKKLIKKRYWKPDFTEKLTLSEDEWREKIFTLLEESVKLRMISDVPIGAFLSGGVDSSAVVALMSKNSVKPVKTFTIGFKEDKYNETEYANRISRMYHTDHQEFVADPCSIDMLPDLVRHFEEPYANSSNIVAYLVSKLARNYVKVVLNGDCADELFAGYDRYQRVKRDYYLENIKTPGKILKEISNRLKIMNGIGIIGRTNKFLNKMDLDFAEKYLSYIAFFQSDEKNKLYNNIFGSKVKITDTIDVIRNKFDEAGKIDLRDRVLYFDLTTYFPDDLLTKIDIASMKVGLEARSPFIDHKLVELSCKIPFNLKVKGIGGFKYILKKSLEGLVPDENLYRRKMGFSIPLDKWFSGNLNGYARSVLLNKNSAIKNIFNVDYIKLMLSNHSERNDMGNKLWSLLTLELWFKSYFG